MQLEAYDGVQLSAREVAFVNAYITNKFNAAAAYRSIGSASDAAKSGTDMVHKAHISKAIKYRLDAMGLQAEEALAELKDVALADFRDLIDVKMRNGEVVNVKMDLASKVRALEIILRAHNRLDNKATAQAAIQININTPGLKEDDLA
jgi:hypothetical protein